jgi:hypothetical protein
MFGGRRKKRSAQVGPLRIRADASGEPTQWSQTIRRLKRQKSPHWDERSRRPFRRDEAYPCNEGFPIITHIGPVSGGLLILFNLILADGTRCQGTVSTARQIEGQPAWAVRIGNDVRHVSYYSVAAWSSL